MKRSRIREVSMEVTVGAFLFMILLALGVFTIILSRQSLFTKKTYYDVRFTTIMGIREGDNVYLRGVIVGKIDDVVVEKHSVQLRLGLDRPLELHENYKMEILPSSMLGGKYLNVEEGDADRPLVPVGAMLTGVTPVDLIDEATRTVTSIREALEGGVLADVSQIVSNANAMVARVERGEGSLGKLLAEDDVYNDIKAVTANLKSISDRIEKGQGSLGKLLADDGKIYQDIEVVAANLRKSSQDLADGKGLIGKLLSEQDTVYDDLRASALAIREITESLNRGEGSIGKLIRENDIYDETKMLLRELRATIDDFRETAPVTTFTSIFLGAF
ncbi:MAG: MCE family protein [Lentisphaerae bacterium]|nr:MCE family protein [Lentisphaerota bacterium]